MNNSLHRLIDGMVAALRTEVIPQISTEFARGQAFGVIYMLNSIRLRTEWSGSFLREQLAAQIELADALRPLLATTAPALPVTAAADADAPALESLRDSNDGRICALIDWLEAQRDQLGVAEAQAIDTALRRYMDRQLKHELSTSAKPMFAEISSGSE